MNQMPDRKKLRQDYLRRTRSHYVSAAIGIAATVIGIFMVVLLLLGTRYIGFPGGRLEGNAILPPLCLCVAVWISVRRLKRAQREVQRIPYVPPVTASTLPNKEILVRGSAEPPIVQNEVLLRAAKEQVTPQEELLRVAEE